MTDSAKTVDGYKAAAARAAIELVKPGMRLRVPAPAVGIHHVAERDMQHADHDGNGHHAGGIGNVQQV